MIERFWKGIAKQECVHEYLDHLQNDTFKQLRAIAGFLLAKVLTRTVEEGVECLVITVWSDKTVIQDFAGPTIDTAVVPEPVRNMMVK